MCYNTSVKGGKSVFDHGAFLVNGVSDSGFTALFDINVSLEMFLFFSHISSFYLNSVHLSYILYKANFISYDLGYCKRCIVRRIKR